MTSILSSLVPFMSNAINSTSQASANQCNSQQANSTDIFGSAFSLNISDAALGALGGNNNSSNASDMLNLTYAGFSGSSQGGTSNFEAVMASLSAPAKSDTGSNGDTLSQLFSMLENMVQDTEKALENIGSPSTTAQISAPTNILGTDNSTSFAESALASGGPLPAFLKNVDTEMELNNTQKQALQDIATQYQNASNTPDTVQSIAAALKQAGIGS